MTQQRRTNYVGPHRVSELYFLGRATNRWRGPCHLQYDSYDSRFRSFITWPRYLKPDPTTLSIASFWYTGTLPIQSVMTHSPPPLPNTHLYLHYFSPTGNGDTTTCFNCGVGLKDGRRKMIPGPSKHFGPHFAFTSGTYIILSPTIAANTKR